MNSGFMLLTEHRRLLTPHQQEIPIGLDPSDTAKPYGLVTLQSETVLWRGSFLEWVRFERTHIVRARLEIQK